MKTPIYIVRVTEDGEQFEYEYANEAHAAEHLKVELSKGNIVTMYADTNY